MDEILKRIAGESEKECLFRIGEAKNNGLLDMTWQQVADWMNAEWRESEVEYRTESAYRKLYRSYSDACQMLDKKRAKDDDTMDEYVNKTKELYKASKQWQDQRRECRKFWTEEARFEHLVEHLVESAEKMCQERPLTFDDSYVSCGDDEALLCFSDWHYGLVTDNIWNRYDVDICKQRVSKLICKVKKYLVRHNIKTLHVLLLGDAAHGSIHTTCRVASEEDVCDQLMHSAEIIAEALNELSQYVNEENVYTTYGNHLRTMQSKNDSIHSDNMERIIPWWLEQRLQNNERVNIVKSEYYEFIYLNVLGYNIVGAHGDLEKFKQFGVTVNTLFSKKYGVTIDYTVSADKHHIEEFEQLGIESILVRSLCGTDEYANNGRLYAAPGQTLMIFSRDEGRECTYNIKV